MKKRTKAFLKFPKENNFIVGLQFEKSLKSFIAVRHSLKKPV